MDVEGANRVCKSPNSPMSDDQDEMMMMADLRRGPWTVEEDLTLINYIAKHGEGRWNSLARCAGLKRTGKSCRLRWLNYLRPDVRRGNITLEEQLLILELHSRWGNRWSKIAQHLPGRTDNEIKNYWRTRVQKHAKQLKCDVNSKQFKDTMRYLWMPRLVERIQAAAASSSAAATAGGPSSGSSTTTNSYHFNNNSINTQFNSGQFVPLPATSGAVGYTPENSSTAASSDSLGTQVSPASDFSDYYNYPINNYSSSNNNSDYFYPVNHNYQGNYPDSLTSPSGYYNPGLEFNPMELTQQSNHWLDGGDTDNLWDVEDIWLLQQQLNNNIM